MNPSCWAPIWATCHSSQLPSLNSGKTECFSMFGSLKEFHIAVCNFTTHIPPVSSKSKWRIHFQGGDHNTALFNSVLQGRRVIFIKRNSVPTIVILKVIVNVEGLWVRNPFRIQSEWKILWSRPWRLHRTHLKLLRKEISLQEAPGLHTRLSCVLSGGTDCFDRSRNADL